MCTQVEAKEYPITISITQTRLFKNLNPDLNSPKLWHEKLSKEKIEQLYGVDAANKILNSDNSPQAKKRPRKG
jgi:hypothetical protein